MANQILQGNNWNTTGNWSGGVIPDNGHNALIPESLNVNVDTGLDQTGKDPDLIRVHEHFQKSLGASGSPLKIAADKIEHYGSGPIYISAAANTTTSNLKIDDALIQAMQPNVVVELSSVNGDKGDWDRIIANRGTVRFLGDIAFGASAKVIIGKVGNPYDVNFTIASGADTLPELHQNAGEGVSNGTITTAYIMGGVLTQDVSAITTAYVGNGAKLVYNHTAATTIVVYSGGTLDLLQTSEPKTITTLWAFPGATILYDDTLHTLSTFNDYRRERP